MLLQSQRVTRPSARAPSGLVSSHRPCVLVRSTPNDTTPKAETAPSQASPSTISYDGSAPASDSSSSSLGKKRKTQVETTDQVATFLSRRFGLAGGLAWLGFLAVGTLGEQIKTRIEVANEEAGTREVKDAPEVTLPSGVTYKDLKIGGGSPPIKGYLAVVHYVGKANGEVFEDTYARGKPLVLFFQGRPFTGGLCLGVEQAMATMKAGGKRIIKVPAALGFGESGAVLRPTLHAGDKSGSIPPNADLEYELELVRVSIPPS